jgi:hypothetical protein
MTTEAQVKISPSMLKTVSVVASIVMATAGAVHVAETFRHGLDDNTAAIQSLDRTINLLSAESWTRSDHEDWVRVLRTLNPDLKIPPEKVAPPTLRKQ